MVYRKRRSLQGILCQQQDSASFLPRHHAEAAIKPELPQFFLADQITGELKNEFYKFFWISTFYSTRHLFDLHIRNHGLCLIYYVFVAKQNKKFKLEDAPDLIYFLEASKYFITHENIGEFSFHSFSQHSHIRLRSC